jgi:hypothetical protein
MTPAARTRTTDNDSYDPAETGERRGPDRYRSRPRRTAQGRGPAGGLDAADRWHPAVARRSRRSWVPGVRVRQAAGAPDRRDSAGGSAAGCAAPGRRGPDAGPLRGGDPARVPSGGRRGGRGPLAVHQGQAAAAGRRAIRRADPGSDRGCPGRPRPGACRVLRPGHRGRFRWRPHAGPPDLGGVRGRRPPGAPRQRDLRRERGRRSAVGARPGAGRDGAGGLPARLPDSGRRGPARPQVRQSGAGGEPRRTADRCADPAGRRRSDAGARGARSGPGALRLRRQTGHRRDRPALPGPAAGRVRVVTRPGPRRARPGR